MKTTISISVDKEAKESAQAIAKSAGLNLSSLVNAYFNQLAATRRIEIYAPEPMTPKLEKRIAEAEKEIAKGNTIGPFSSADDFIKALKSD